MKILCVDDDLTTRILYRNGLAITLPHDDIQEAESGDAAIAMMSQTPFDVVITDLEMPGSSGLDVIRFVKSHPYPTEVLVVTGKASIDSAVEAMRFGARDYLEKPINIPLLTERVENIRDYFDRLNESEDMRLAKETYELNAGRQLHILEHQLQASRQAISQALRMLDTQGASIPPETASAIQAILTPHGWEG